jgi:type IV secretion system protein VirD4
VIDGLMETISRAAGIVPVTFILDEFPQLKPAPAVTRCLRLYASLGVQMYVFAQSRYAIEDVWGRAFTKELEDQASVLQILNCDDPQLIKDIELWSGFTTVVVRGFNVNGGVIENVGSGLSEQRRAVLQPENIRGIGPDQQLLRIAPCPHLFVAHRIPYFRMEPVKDRIRDVRAYHAGVAEFGGTSLDADGDDDEGC